jgi:TorA maturation chaperone TorD
LTADLALLAERRAGLAGLLGLLLLEEPGPQLADLVGTLPALAALASGDPVIDSDYERIFLRGVPIYESVFRNDDGQHGGETLANIVGRYNRVGYNEHTEQRWRIAGADHLGLELRCYAHLCHNEATAWRADIPDKAVEAVEIERAFLADHLAAWAQIALAAVAPIAVGSLYEHVVGAVGDFLHEEIARLRPAPLLGQEIDIDPLPTNFGPFRLARLILSPATAGTWLQSNVIAHAAERIGSPWRPSDNRSALRHVIEAAQDSGDLASILQPILMAVRVAGAEHAERAGAEPANEANWRIWRARASAMSTFLGQIIASNGLGTATTVVTEYVAVTGAEAALLADAVDAAVAELRKQGFEVDRIPNGIDVTALPDFAKERGNSPSPPGPTLRYS